MPLLQDLSNSSSVCFDKAIVWRDFLRQPTLLVVTSASLGGDESLLWVTEELGDLLVEGLGSVLTFLTMLHTTVGLTMLESPRLVLLSLT